MDIRYQKPSNEKIECEFLQENFLTCLKEKSLKDEIPDRLCNMEYVLWYFLECPNKSQKFQESNFMRNFFLEEKMKMKNIDESDEDEDDDEDDEDED